MVSHLEEVNMTYKEHFLFSSKIGFDFLYGAVLAFVHAIFPEIQKDSSSRLVKHWQTIFDSMKK